MPDRRSLPAKSAVPWALLAVAAAIVFVAVVRLRVADIPLERDEGEYAYAGRLILEGIPPYKIAYNMKFPGTYYAYALILALFGKTAWGIHAGLLAVNAASIVLTFLVGRRLMGELAGTAAAVSFAFLSVDRWVLGIFAHATHFVVLAVLAGLYLLLRALEDGRVWKLVAGGVAFGIAVLFKQHAAIFLPLAAGLVFWPEKSFRRVGWLALGSVIPVAGVLLVLGAQGVFPTFWFWTFKYASAYVSYVPASEAVSSLGSAFAYIATASWASWLVAAFGIVVLWRADFGARARLVVTALLIASFLAVIPGFFFRAHYFILMLPAVALLIGAAVAALPRILPQSVAPRTARWLSIALVVAPIGTYVAAERQVLFTLGTNELSREIYGLNPFIEAVEIAKYIRERTSPDEKIAVVGSEPEIYFYADRKGATGYIYTYALMEPQPYAPMMQDAMIDEVERAHPRYVVFPWIEQSWLAQPGSDQKIINWGRRYVRQCYDPVVAVEILSPYETNISFDEAARTYQASTPNLVYAFKRKSEEPCTAPR
jgi:4-amino-4-deoxy-L-arabinose transferase-like glycosyltransferase